MPFRLWLSRLAEGTARRAASRWLFVFALAGFALTLVFLAATGRDTSRWFFFLMVWLGLVYLPLWLLTQAFQSLGPALRRTLRTEASGRQDRYGSAARATLVVEELFERKVLLPRIATPEQAYKAREAASALVLRAGAPLPGPGGTETGALGHALRRCLGAVDEWTRQLSRAAEEDTAGNIQARWGEARGLAALAALAKTLLAVWEDQGHREAPAGVGGGIEALHGFLDAVLDYCDELALQVQVVPWTEAPLGLGAEEALREAWGRYAGAPSPAPSALEAFLKAALSPHAPAPL